ncbi:unnamed protein product, partial [Didymodactylos carnosus]
LNTPPVLTHVEDVRNETQHMSKEFIRESAFAADVEIDLIKAILDFDPLSLRQHSPIQTIAQTLRLIGDELDQDLRLKRYGYQIPELYRTGNYLIKIVSDNDKSKAKSAPMDVNSVYFIIKQ